MGYTTEFKGQFDLDRRLTEEHFDYLCAFAETRRMKRDPSKIKNDPLRVKVGLPPGVDGEFFVGAEGFKGQNDDSSVLNHNSPPRTQPGLWCQWVPFSREDRD